MDHFCVLIQQSHLHDQHSGWTTYNNHIRFGVDTSKKEKGERLTLVSAWTILSTPGAEGTLKDTNAQSDANRKGKMSVFYRPKAKYCALQGKWQGKTSHLAAREGSAPRGALKKLNAAGTEACSKVSFSSYHPVVLCV